MSLSGTALRKYGVGLGMLGFGVLTGCADPCVELQEICDDCRDPNQRASCERSVDEDPSDVCEQNVDSYRNICD